MKWINPSPCKQGRREILLKLIHKYKCDVNTLKFPAQWNNSDPAIFFFLKMFAYYVCCTFSKALRNIFIMGANTMNTDQTAPNLREMSDLSSYCLQYRLSKYVS